MPRLGCVDGTPGYVYVAGIWHLLLLLSLQELVQNALSYWRDLYFEVVHVTSIGFLKQAKPAMYLVDRLQAY